MKNTIIAIVVLVIIVLGIFYFTRDKKAAAPVANEPATTETTTTPPPPTPQQIAQSQKNAPEVVIGKSVEGNDIKAYRFGTGPKEILFISGIHGGYSWNTVLLAREMMDYLKQNPTLIPTNIKVTIVPVLNPDGLKKVVGTADSFTQNNVPTTFNDTIPGRFNANNVDLNRNFDCDWKSEGVWKNNKVSGGSNAFSEPETEAVKNYVEGNNPAAVVAFYASAGGVFASSCHNGVLAETSVILKAYADASGYKPYADFDFYEITGDMVNWLAKINVPAISVLLSNHADIEKSKNLAGLQALLDHYSK